MPINKKGRVTFTTTLFALIRFLLKQLNLWFKLWRYWGGRIILTLCRDNLKINVRESAEMDQADLELRATIMKVISLFPNISQEFHFLIVQRNGSER